jgi:signal transduction histidine kinase
MKRLAFRSRLTLWSTLLVAMVLLIFGTGAGIFVHRRALAQLDAHLRAESAHFFSELRVHGGAQFDWRKIEREMVEWMPPTHPPRLMEIRTADGTVRFGSAKLAPSGFTASARGLQTLPLGDDKVRLFVDETDGVVFVIGASLQETAALSRDLILALLAVLPVALAFALFGGRWLASMAIKPVEEITAAAESVTAEHLDQRVPVPAVSDETQRLATVLNATFDRLERNYQQALRFSADASHELKTPLTVLRASIEALLDSASLDDDDRAAVAGLLEQTQRLANIIASLLLLARADAGRLALEFAEHDLTTLTEACVEDARIIAEQRGIRVECALAPGAVTDIDALRFSQIVGNLLDNAVKYNCEGGEVRVTLAADGSSWRLTVANTGEGIPIEFQSRLFERFFRVEGASEGGQGLGLGLARELARAHGGDIVLVRSDSEWTEFALTLSGQPKQRRAAVRTHQGDSVNASV